MNLSNIFNVFTRDLRIVLRDKRSLIFMIAVPIVLIPLLVVLLSVLTKQGVENLQATPAKIAVIGQEHLSPQLYNYLTVLNDEDAVVSFISDNHKQLDPFVRGLVVSQSKQTIVDFQVDYLPALIEQAKLATSLKLIDLNTGFSNIPEMLRDYSPDYLQSRLDDDDLPDSLNTLRGFTKEIEEKITARVIDAVLVFHPGFSEKADKGEVAEFTVFYSDTYDYSRTANRKIRRFLAKGAQGASYALLQEHEIPLSVFNPLTGQKINVGNDFNVISRILPYFIILTCFIGGLYPALDNLAGEKERQTLETLLLSPAKRSEIMLGKYLLIFSCAVVSAVLCMCSLSLTLVTFGQGVEALSLEFKLSYFLLSLLLIMPLGSFFAALLMTLSVLARSYKEAQAYTMPINFFIIIPAFYSLIPGTTLGVKESILPVINVSLALREVWSGVPAIPHLSYLFISTVIYAAIAIIFCAYLAKKESVLFRS